MLFRRSAQFALPLFVAVFSFVAVGCSAAAEPDQDPRTSDDALCEATMESSDPGWFPAWGCEGRPGGGSGPANGGAGLKACQDACKATRVACETNCNKNPTSGAECVVNCWADHDSCVQTCR
jgi:hypothetical protein